MALWVCISSAAICMLHALEFLLRNLNHAAVALAGLTHAVFPLAEDAEIASRQRGRHHGQIALARVELIHNQAPAAVGKPVALRALHAGQIFQRAALDGLRRIVQTTHALSNDALGGLILGEAVIPLPFPHDGCVDEVILLLRIQRGFRIGEEIRGVGGINALLGLRIAAQLHHGGKEDHEGLLFLIPDGLGRPDIAGAFHAHGTAAGLGPVHQVVGFPDDQVAAAGGDGLAPITGAINTKVGGDQVIPPRAGMLHHKGIPHALFPQGRTQHRLAAIEILPVEAILADGEVDLLPLLIAFTDKMCKQITGHAITSKAFCP